MGACGHVVVFGSMNMDLSVGCERMPRAGETVSGDGFLTNAGGKGANQVVAAAKMGAAAHMIAAVGQDGFGDELVGGLEAVGVDCSQVMRAADAATGVAVIVRSGGDNRIVLAAGANLATTASDVTCALDALEAAGVEPGASVFMAQGECDLATTAEALLEAHRRGYRTVFNPAPACQLAPEAWRAVDVVCLNETECDLITHILPADNASCTAALEALGRLTGHVAVITLGEAGSVTLADGELVRVPARVVEAVDTTAAGDTYLGALAALMVQGVPLVEAMRRATCASALAVTRLGAQCSIPWAEEVDRFAEEGA